MYKLIDLLMILVALVEMRMVHWQIKSSSSPLTVKIVLKWEVVMGGLFP